MDSRIREIEQWVAEAREGLSDGGREVYLRKLYLLEAEIRAVIKENGMLPQGTSPVPEEKRVRRSVSPAWTFNMSAAAAGALVLAATTFYFVNSGSRPTSSFTVPPRLADARTTKVTDTNPPTRNRLAAVMAGEGEELLPDSWTPETESSLLAAAPASTGQAQTYIEQGQNKQIKTGGQKPVILASGGTAKQTPPAAPAKPGAKPAGKPASRNDLADDATDVVILASAATPEQATGKQASKVGKGGGSRPGSMFDMPTISYNFFPEGMAPPAKPLKSRVKSSMDKLAQDKSVDKSKKAEVLVDNEGGDEDDSADAKEQSAGKAADSGDEAGTEGGQSGEKSDS